MKKLLPYLRGYAKECILGPLFKLLEASFELLVPLVVAAICDRGIGGGDRSFTWRMALLLAGLALVGWLCAVTAQYFAAKAACGFAAKVKSALFAHLQGLSYREYDTLGTSAMITRLTGDMNQLQNGVNMFLRLLLRSPFVVFGAMIMAFTIDVPGALLFAVLIPLLAAVTFAIILGCAPLYRTIRQKLDGLLLATRENVTGVRVIRAFRLEEQEKRAFDEKNQVYTRLQKRAGNISALLNPVTYVLINFGVLALLYTGGWRVENGDLTQGQVVALYNYMSQILVELIKLANLIVTLTKASACGKRVAAMLDTENTLPDGTETGEPETDTVLEFRHVSFRYPGAGADSLSDLSLTLKKGQTLGIIGATGSGKSTAVNLIPRFYDVTGGELAVFGRPVSRWDIGTLRDRIGVVPQKATLFRGTVRDNLRWGDPNATDEALWQALETACAADFIREKPEGLDAPVEQGGRNFSGGQRQRLTVARALVKRPSLLILDDSASALDFATEANLRQRLSRDDPSRTTIIVSQRASGVMHADWILVLEEGCTAGLGTHEQLLRDCPTYREIYETQFERGGRDSDTKTE